MKRDLLKARNLSNPPNITIDADFAADPKHTSEILASVGSVSENMQESDLSCDSRKQAGKQIENGKLKN